VFQHEDLEMIPVYVALMVLLFGLMIEGGNVIL
jgi:hypothetical protein